MSWGCAAHMWITLIDVQSIPLILSVTRLREIDTNDLRSAVGTGPILGASVTHSCVPLAVPHLTSNSRQLLFYCGGNCRISLPEQRRDLGCHLFDVAKTSLAAASSARSRREIRLPLPDV